MSALQLRAASPQGRPSDGGPGRGAPALLGSLELGIVVLDIAYIAWGLSYVVQQVSELGLSKKLAVRPGTFILKQS